jgi:hypothetical protein
MPEFALWKPAEYEGPYWRKERLKQLFPAEAGALDRYYQFYDQMLKLMGIARQSETARGIAGLWLKIRLWLAFQPVKDKVKWSGLQLMDHYFKSPALKTVFLGIVADFVRSEFRAGVPRSTRDGPTTHPTIEHEVRRLLRLI